MNCKVSERDPRKCKNIWGGCKSTSGNNVVVYVIDFGAKEKKNSKKHITMVS